MMHDTSPLATHASPAERPQPIAFHAGSLWLGCWGNSHLYGIDPKTWATKSEIALPGMPYGITAFGGALRIVVSIGEADDRYIYRYVPGEPITEAGRVPCPDLTGSHLTTDGTSLYLVQQTHQRIVTLNEDGSVARTFPLPTRCAGIGYDGTHWIVISADDDFDVLQLATLDLAAQPATVATFAPMNVEARGLAFDGTAWWTSYRELGKVVSFSL